MTRVVIKRKPVWEIRLGLALDDGRSWDTPLHARANDIGELMDDDEKMWDKVELPEELEGMLEDEDMIKKVVSMTFSVRRV